MNEQEIGFIQNQIGYTFQNKKLLEQAFTRRSYSAENGGEDNEVLEFVGDKVLDYVVVKLLAERYGHLPENKVDLFGHIVEVVPGWFHSDRDEGKLTELKMRLVQKTTLADAIDSLGLADFLIVGKSDEENGVRGKASVKEDLFEAILGVIALDSAWDVSILQDCICMMLNIDGIIGTEGINYVSEIQKWSLRRTGEIPLHRVDRISMQASWCFPEDPRCIYGKAQEDTHFMCEMQMLGFEPHFVGYGSSKAAARADASKLAYEYLSKNDLLLSIRDDIGNPNCEDSIGQLEILARKGHFSIPQYDFNETHDENGNPIWKCDCNIPEIKKKTSATSSVKKDAKKKAAFEMLKYVLEEGNSTR